MENFSIELLHNHRPPAPPTEYFQFNVGGYDTANLLRTSTGMPELQGFIGCVRGLKIGDNLIDLAVIAEENIARGKWVVRFCHMLFRIFYWPHPYTYNLCSYIKLEIQCNKREFYRWQINILRMNNFDNYIV